tara:strand:+ start:1488 stop:2993 length:1506 start_codon:yes stop_codon:yes gene_type:complete
MDWKDGLTAAAVVGLGYWGLTKVVKGPIFEATHHEETWTCDECNQVHYEKEDAVECCRCYHNSAELESWGHAPRNEGDTSEIWFRCNECGARLTAEIHIPWTGGWEGGRHYADAETFGAEGDTIKFEVGQRYTFRYHHGHHFRDWEVVRRTVNSVWFSQVNPENGKVDKSQRRFKIHTSQGWDRDGLKIPPRESIKLGPMAYPVVAGEVSKNAESFEAESEIVTTLPKDYIPTQKELDELYEAWAKGDLHFCDESITHDEENGIYLCDECGREGDDMVFIDTYVDNMRAESFSADLYKGQPCPHEWEEDNVKNWDGQFFTIYVSCKNCGTKSYIEGHADEHSQSHPSPNSPYSAESFSADEYVYHGSCEDRLKKLVKMLKGAGVWYSNPTIENYMEYEGVSEKEAKELVSLNWNDELDTTIAYLLDYAKDGGFPRTETFEAKQTFIIESKYGAVSSEDVDAMVNEMHLQGDFIRWLTRHKIHPDVFNEWAYQYTQEMKQDE